MQAVQTKYLNNNEVAIEFSRKRKHEYYTLRMQSVLREDAFQSWFEDHRCKYLSNIC